jgi:hypothetical protein
MVVVVVLGTEVRLQLESSGVRLLLLLLRNASLRHPFQRAESARLVSVSTSNRRQYLL